MKYFFKISFFVTLLIAQVGMDKIKISQVQVDGNVGTSKKTIIFTAGLREGQTITSADFPRAIKRLWQLGLFQDIQIHYDEETEEGISLKIIVKENYILDEIHYKGNKKLKNNKLDEELNFSQGQRIKPNTIHEAAKKIKALYTEKGYLNVKVTPALVVPTALGGTSRIDRPVDVGNAEIDNFKNAAYDLNDKIVELKERLQNVSEGLLESNDVLDAIAQHSEGPIGWAKVEMAKSISSAETPTKFIASKLGILKSGIVDGSSELKSVPDDLEAIGEQTKLLLGSAKELPKAARSLGFKNARRALKSIKSTTAILKNIPNEIKFIGDESKLISNQINVLIKNIAKSIKLEKIEFTPYKKPIEEKESEKIPEEKSILYTGKNKGLVRNIVFTVEENDKIKIGKIIFEGNNSFSSFRLRWQMKETKQQPWFMFWRSTFDKKKYQDDLNLVSTFYRNKGYRDFHFTNDSIIYSENFKKMNIVLTLKEGAQYKYRKFSWEGMSLFSEDILMSALGLKTGEKYGEEEFNIALFSRVQGLYLDRGYIYSRIEPKITPIGEDSLDIHFVITENHKVYINNIAVKGNTRTRENVIRRQLRIFPGDIYNQERIARSYREVMMLNFFANAAPNIVPVSEDKVDIEFQVEEKPAGQASANMGYSQYLGLTGGGGLSLPNFRGKGQSLSFSFNAGVSAGSQNQYAYQNSYANTPKSRSASLSFTDPMVNDTKNLVGGSIYYRMMGGSTMYYSPLETTIAGASIMLGRIFKWPDDYFRGTWQFQLNRRQYQGTQEDIDRYAGGRTKSDGISINQSIRRDSRDHPEFPTIGSSFSLKSSLSGWILGGQENFHKHTLNLEWFTPTFWKFVLMNSMKIGVIKALPSKNDEGSYIPYNDRFIMGGNGIPYGNALRGYDDNRVGPLTVSGNPIGGNTIVKFGTEFRVPFAENPVVYGVIFAEMGNVWSSIDLMERLSLPRNGPLDLKRSVGIGVRFFMPMIGMLGFDLGYGFDRVSQYGELEPAWKTSLTFGQQY